MMGGLGLFVNTTSWETSDLHLFKAKFLSNNVKETKERQMTSMFRTSRSFIREI